MYIIISALIDTDSVAYFVLDDYCQNLNSFMLKRHYENASPGTLTGED